MGVAGSAEGGARLTRAACGGLEWDPRRTAAVKHFFEALLKAMEVRSAFDRPGDQHDHH